MLIKLFVQLFYKKNIDAKEDEEEGQVNAAYEKDAHEKDEKKSVSSSDNSSDSQGMKWNR